MAAKKKTGKAVVKWDEEFADYAKDATQGVRVSEGRKWLRFSGGQMTYDGNPVPDDEVRCVIIGWSYHNTFYDPNERFDPDNPQSPLCYSFGRNEDEQEVHEDSPEPQHDACAGCPMNEWESGVGKAKACKNTVRLALIAEDDLENLDEAEIAWASIPPTSLRNWNKYFVNDVGKKAGRPPWAVVTLLSRIPDSGSQFKITFDLEELIEDSDLFGPLKELHEDVMEDIEFPYVVYEAEERPKKSGRGKSKTKASQKKFAKK